MTYFRVLLVISSALIIVVSSIGCNSSINLLEREAKNVITDIPLPDTFYNSNNGHQMLPRAITSKIVSYDTKTGYPLFEIFIYYYDESFFSRLWPSNYDRKFYLILPDGISWESGVKDIDGNWISKHTNYRDKFSFTIEELKLYYNELIWR